MGYKKVECVGKAALQRGGGEDVSSFPKKVYNWIRMQRK